LLKAFVALKEKFDIGLHIIGSGPEETLVNSFVKEHKDIYFYGPIHDLQLSSKYIYASDLMVMPGYVGLSVVHAMAIGCPVLTCRQGENGPFHSPEVEYIIEDSNGKFCDYSVDGLIVELSNILKDSKKMDLLSIKARQTITIEASMELFSSGFEQAINYVSE
jgi:glycosyltransferase involved in cell wall biosynthesis